MFQIITASFLAVALTAAVLPLRYATRLKKSDRWGSFKLPIALAALRSAIFKRLLPLGILLLNAFPPDILLLGANRSQLANCLAVSNFLNPPSPAGVLFLHNIVYTLKDHHTLYLRQSTLRKGHCTRHSHHHPLYFNQSTQDKSHHPPYFNQSTQDENAYYRILSQSDPSNDLKSIQIHSNLLIAVFMAISGGKNGLSNYLDIVATPKIHFYDSQDFNQLLQVHLNCNLISLQLYKLL